MKAFYKDELTLMCQGYSDGVADMGDVDAGDSSKKGESTEGGASVEGTVWGQPSLSGASLAVIAAGNSSAIGSIATAATSLPTHDDRKYPTATPQGYQATGPTNLMPPLAPTSNANSHQQQQQQNEAQLKERPSAVAATTKSRFTASSDSTTPSFQSSSVEAGTQSPKTTPNPTLPLAQNTMAAMDEDQILQFLLEHQQSCNNSGGTRIPNDAVVTLILNHKASLQQRERKLAEEMRGLQLRSALLGMMLEQEVNVTSSANFKPQSSGRGGVERANCDVASMYATAVAAGHPNASLLPQTLTNVNTGTENQTLADSVVQQQQQHHQRLLQQQQSMNFSHLFATYQNNVPAAASQGGSTGENKQGKTTSRKEELTKQRTGNLRKGRKNSSDTN